MSQAIVESVRSQYPTPLGDAHADFLLEVAAALDRGLVLKDSGTNITLPDGTRVSQDCVMAQNGAAWDVLQDAEGEAIPVYHAIDPIEPTRYYAVEDTTPPDPDDGEEEDPCAAFPAFDEDVRASLGRIEQSLARLEAALPKRGK